MLNFRTTSFLFIISCAGMITLHYSTGSSWWWLFALVLMYITCIVIGSSNIRSNFYTTAYNEGITSEKKIAITFDDGPTPFTKTILQTLSHSNAPATFFMIGKNMLGNEEVVRQVITNGHTIGNHTFSHSFFIDFNGAAAFKKELQQTDDLFQKITGKRLKFFRPPYGVTTPHLTKAARELDYKIIGWTIRSLDTTTDKEDVIFKRVAKQLKPGAIILFHDTSEKTNTILIRLLEFAKEKGYRIVGLEELLETKAYH